MATTKIKIESPDQVFNVLSQTSAGQTYKLTGGKKKNSPSLVLAFTNALRTAQSDGAGTTAFGSITDGVKNKNGDISFSFEGRTVIVGKGLFGFAQRLFTSTPADGRLFEVGTAWTVYAQANPPGPTPGPGPTPTPGQTFTLTTNIEVVPATGTMGANSTVNGFVNAAAAAGANTGTFQTGDTINGNATSDVKIQILQNTQTLAQINTAKSVNLRGLLGAGVAVAAGNEQNALLWSGIGSITSTDSISDVSVVQAPLAATYKLINPTISTGAGVAADLTVAIRAQDATGAANAINFEINNVGSSVGTTAVPVASPAILTVSNNSTGTTGGIERVNVATTGTNNSTLTLGTDATTLAITGSGSNTIAVNTISGSAKTVTLAGATGNNTLNLGANIASADTLTGGSGTDTLRIAPAGLNVVGVNASAFETLRINSAAAGAVSFAASPAFSTVRIDSGAGGAVANLLNIGGFSTLALVGAGTTAAAGATQAFNGITATGGFTGSADTLAINIGNQGTTITNAAAYTPTGAITVNGVETVNLAVSNVRTTGVTTVTSLASNTLTSFSASSAGSVVMTALNAANATSLGALSSVNFAGVTTTTQVSAVSIPTNSLAAFATVTAGAGGLTLTPGAEQATDSLSFNGAAGVDTLVGGVGSFAGILNFYGLGGADVANFTSPAAATVQYTNLTAVPNETGITVATADQITGFAPGTDLVRTGTPGTAGVNFVQVADADYIQNFANILAAANGALTATAAYVLVTDTDAAAVVPVPTTYLFYNTVPGDGAVDAMTIFAGNINIAAANIV